MSTESWDLHSFVFCDESGARLTHSIVKDVVPKACKKSGLAKRITTHGLRHTFASHLVMRGLAPKAVQVLDRPVPAEDGAHGGHKEG